MLVVAEAAAPRTKLAWRSAMATEFQRVRGAAACSILATLLALRNYALDSASSFSAEFTIYRDFLPYIDMLALLGG